MPLWMKTVRMWGKTLICCFRLMALSKKEFQELFNYRYLYDKFVFKWSFFSLQNISGASQQSSATVCYSHFIFITLDFSCFKTSPHLLVVLGEFCNVAVLLWSFCELQNFTKVSIGMRVIRQLVFIFGANLSFISQARGEDTISHSQIFAERTECLNHSWSEYSVRDLVEEVTATDQSHALN